MIKKAITLMKPITALWLALRHRNLQWFFVFPLLFNSCIDPVTPEFNYKEGLVFVEGFASTQPGASYVSISVSAIEFNVKVVNDVTRAEVAFIQPETGQRIVLEEQQGGYVPPVDFAVAPGESWLVDILLEDGSHYRSTPEKVIAPVAIREIDTQYDPKLYYQEASGKYVPGHRVLLTIDDPLGVDNQYYWTFRTFENLEYCDKCNFQIFREGTCQGGPQGTHLEDYYDYKCESDCWKIRYPEKISIFDDSFTDGQEIRELAVAEIPLYTKENLVVEIQQFSLTPKAYAFYKVLKDLVDNNRGLNAPPPTALIGNMRNVDNDQEFVFGRFTVAASATARIFIDRAAIEEEAIDRKLAANFEGCEVCPPGSACPIGCSPVTTTPCSETRYRTGLVPEGWIEK